MQKDAAAARSRGLAVQGAEQFMSSELILGGLLRAIGAFYALGSLLVLWGTLTSALADQATAAIEARPVPRMLRWKT